MFAIQKNFPAPVLGAKGSSKYPFSQMEKGDSFFVPNGSQGGVYTMSQKYKKRNGGQFIVRKVEGGVRCWRVE